MNRFHDSENFKMTEPSELGIHSKYAFWLETKYEGLFDYVKTLICVAAVTGLGKTRRLIAIKDDYDADEAWHYIRTELEYEASVVMLDPIWEDAMRWL